MSDSPMIETYTTMEEFELLHERHDRTRSTSRTVTVDRQALIHILMDHGHMLDAMHKLGRVDIREPSDPATAGRSTSMRSRSPGEVAGPEAGEAEGGGKVRDGSGGSEKESGPPVREHPPWRRPHRS